MGCPYPLLTCDNKKHFLLQISIYQHDKIDYEIFNFDNADKLIKTVEDYKKTYRNKINYKIFEYKAKELEIVKKEIIKIKEKC